MESKMCFVVVLFIFGFKDGFCRRDDDEDEPYDPYTVGDPKKREPSPCEICKYFITELQSRLAESDNSKEVIRTGHGLDSKKEFKYKTSELRLTEALLEPHICDKILEYNVHAERDGSNRYAKGMSETFQTLHGLVNKGVKVELGMPYELWDKPSAEVTKMHRSCFKLAEDHEDDIEDWYYKNQKEDLMTYLCEKRYLPKFPDNKFNKECLKEYYKPKGDKGAAEQAEEKPAGKKSKKRKDNDGGKEDQQPSAEDGKPITDAEKSKKNGVDEDNHTEL